MRRGAASIALLAVLAVARPEGAPGAAPVAPSPPPPAAFSGLTANELALIINDNDPLSIQVGAYYQQRRNIPTANVVHVHLPVTAALSRADFLRAEREVQRRVPSQVQALALAWAEPFRVECMSITSAFALGFSPGRCDGTCEPTQFSPYFDSNSHAPYHDLGIRPTMLLAARSLEQARALIDRGLAADGSAPHGTAYLLDTSDARRNQRASSFGFARALAGDGVNVQVVQADVLRNRPDVLFYFTGLVRVADLQSNRFLPGALADHLTSAGGVLDGTRQMTSLEWLEAGATASYGTVVEPCNYPGKFPNIPVVMRHYLDGETAVESYWKSVLMPAEGLFIGEPLATPFRGADWTGIAAARHQIHTAVR